MNFPPRNNTPPPGFRQAECVIHTPDGPMNYKSFIPDDDHYPAQAKKLSRDITRSSKYKQLGWNDALKTTLKTREATISQPTPFGIAYKTVREIHDVEKSPEESLIKIHLVTMNNTGEKIKGEPIYPTEYVVYTPSNNNLKRYYWNTYNESMNPLELTEAMELADQTGESETTDREKILFYATLVQFSAK